MTLFFWRVSITKLPIVLKGILRPDDAELAVQHGVSAIGVSNHGGRQLDGVQATVNLANVSSTYVSVHEIDFLFLLRRLTHFQP